MKFIMNFLRSPFQFRSTDQSNKKSDSASPIVENMFIDPTTGISTDPKWRASSPGLGASGSVPGSPRLQHRVPGFENNGSCPIEVIREPTISPSSNEDGERGQRVHVVPIKVESVDDSSSPKRRPGTFHSSSGTIPRSSQFGPLHPNFEELQNRKRHSSGPASHKKSDTTESRPKVCNIPIFVEGRDTPVVPKTSPSSQSVPVHRVTTPERQTTATKQNGGNLAKCASKTKQSNCDVSLKQISDIVSEFQTLKRGVDEFKGVPQDKQYRYLDEMLTRCMLKLDNVETHGDDEVRASRKAAVKAIEKCITDLESRAQANTKSEQPAVTEECNPPELSSTTKEEEMKVSEDQPTMVADQAQEKSIPSEFTGTTREVNVCQVQAKEMNATQEQSDVSVCKDIQNSCVSSEQSAAGESSTASSQPQCPESESSSSKDKPELSETPQALTENIESMDVVDANQNCEDVADKSMDVDQMSVKKSEEQVDGTQAQVGHPVDSGKDSKTLAESSSEPMETTEVSTVPVDLTKQNEPMESEVPKAKLETEEIKGEIVDSELVELTKQPVSTENVSPAIAN